MARSIQGTEGCSWRAVHQKDRQQQSGSIQQPDGGNLNSRAQSTDGLAGAVGWCAPKGSGRRWSVVQSGGMLSDRMQDHCRLFSLTGGRASGVSLSVSGSAHHWQWDGWSIGGSSG